MAYLQAQYTYSPIDNSSETDTWYDPANTNSVIQTTQINTTATTSGLAFDGELGIQDLGLVGAHYVPSFAPTTTSYTTTTIETNQTRTMTTVETGTTTTTDLRFYAVLGGHEFSYESQNVTTDSTVDSHRGTTRLISDHETNHDVSAETTIKSFGYITWQSATENSTSTLTEITTNQTQTVSTTEMSSVSVAMSRQGDDAGNYTSLVMTTTSYTLDETTDNQTDHVTRHETGSDTVSDVTSGNEVNGMSYNTLETTTDSYSATESETNGPMSSTLTDSYTATMATITNGYSASGSYTLVLSGPATQVESISQLETNGSQTVSLDETITTTLTSQSEQGNEQNGIFSANEGETTVTSTHEVLNNQTYTQTLDTTDTAVDTSLENGNDISSSYTLSLTDLDNTHTVATETNQSTSLTTTADDAVSSSSTEMANETTGVYTLTEYSSSSTHEIQLETTQSLTINAVVDEYGSGTTTDTGNTITGSYTLTEYSSASTHESNTETNQSLTIDTTIDNSASTNSTETGGEVTGSYTLDVQMSNSVHEEETQTNQSLTLDTTTDENSSASTSESGNTVTGDYTLTEQSSTSTHDTSDETNQSLTIDTTTDNVGSDSTYETGNTISTDYTISEQSSVSTHVVDDESNQSLTVNSTTDETASTTSNDTGNHIAGGYTLTENLTASTHEEDSQANQGLTTDATIDEQVSSSTTDTGNEITGDYTVTDGASSSTHETDTTSIHLQTGDTTTDVNASSTSTETGDAITGSYSLNEATSTTTTDTADQFNQGFTASITESLYQSTSTSDSGNDATGDYTITELQSDQSSRMETDFNQALTVTTTEIDSVSSSATITGNSLVGNATTTSTSTDSSTLMESQIVGAQTVNSTQTVTSQNTVTQTANDITGDLTVYENATTTTIETETDANQSLVVQQFSSASASLSSTQTGNTITGDFTLVDDTQAASSASMTETNADLTVTRIELDSTSTNETGTNNEITGSATITTTVHDSQSTQENDYQTGQTLGLDGSATIDSTSTLTTNAVTGDYSIYETGNSTVSLVETTDIGALHISATSIDVTTTTVQESGNEITGDYTQQTGVSDSLGSTQTGDNGAYSLVVTSDVSTSGTTTDTGNTFSGSETLQESSSSSGSSQEIDTYSNGDSTTHSAGITGTDSQSREGNTITGDYSLSENSASTLTIQETGTRGGISYTLSGTQNTTSRHGPRGQRPQRAYTGQQTQSDTLSETRSTNGYVQQTDSSDGTSLTISSGNALDGSYQESGSALSSSTLIQTTGNTLSVTQTTTDQWTISQETGNVISGEYSGTKTGTVNTTFNEEIANGPSISQTDNATQTINYGGNAVTGQSSQTITSTDVYGMTQLGSNYTLTENGNSQSTREETDDAVTGNTTSSITGSDTATLVESGSDNTFKSYSETLIATDTFNENDSGNASSGAFSRSGGSNGSFEKTLDGTTVSMSSSNSFAESGSFSLTTSGSLNSGFVEEGNGTAGGFTESISGIDRYSLLESWDVVSQGSGQRGAGNVDVTPWGPAYSERGPESVWQTTGSGNMPQAPGDGSVSATRALGQALDGSRYQSGYLTGAGLTPWVSGSARSGWQSQESYSQLGQDAYALACFLAGTHLLTPDGSKPIEQFQVGDQILSRSESDVSGEVAVKSVEQVFVRTSRIMILRIGGRDIGTTAEHPFWARNVGWLPAGKLEPGMELSSHDGQWVPVERVRDTGEHETVYNLRVSDYRTYFVGDQSWGWSVWAHNTYWDDFRSAVKDQGLSPSEIQDAYAAGQDHDWNKFQSIVGGNGFTSGEIKSAYDATHDSGLPGVEPRVGERQIPDALYDALRKRTPSQEIRDLVNEGKVLPFPDEALPGLMVTKRLHADHIVSMDTIASMEGFDQLSEDQQLEVLNNPKNFIGLSETANTSKGAKSYAEWTRYNKGGIDVDPAFRQDMMQEEIVVARVLQQQIDTLVGQNQKASGKEQSAQTGPAATAGNSTFLTNGELTPNSGSIDRVVNFVFNGQTFSFTFPDEGGAVDASILQFLNNIQNGTVKLTQDPAPSAQQDTSTATVSNDVTAAQLQTIINQAQAEWAAAGATAAQMQTLRNAAYAIAPLPAGELGLTTSDVVTISPDAAGTGWFIDPTPADNVEFSDAIAATQFDATAGSPAFGLIDLLTVVSHEMGHLLGIPDFPDSAAPDDLMALSLTAGIRRIPQAADLQYLVTSAVSPAPAPADTNSAPVPTLTATAPAIGVVAPTYHFALPAAQPWLSPPGASVGQLLLLGPDSGNLGPLTDGEFNQGANGLTGWSDTSPPYVTVNAAQQAVIKESPSAPEVDLYQDFLIPAGATTLSFTIDGFTFDNSVPSGVTPDAFGASLLDPVSQAPIAGTADGFTDSFFIQDVIPGSTGEAATGVIVTPGAVAGTERITLDVSSLGGKGARLVFRFIGGSDLRQLMGSAAISDVGFTGFSTTTLTSDAPSGSVYGQSVTFTATVSSSAGNGGVPSGSVTFYDGQAVLGTGTLSNGMATYHTTMLSAGSHFITADYAGNNDFQPSSTPTAAGGGRQPGHVNGDCRQHEHDLRRQCARLDVQLLWPGQRRQQRLLRRRPDDQRDIVEQRQQLLHHRG